MGKVLASYEKSGKSTNWNIPLAKGTEKQFAATQKPQPGAKFEQIKVTFVDQDDNPIADLKLRYIGFHLFDDSRGWSLRLNLSLIHI